MRRITLLVLLLLLAAVASPVVPGVAQSSQPAAVQQAGGVRADFNQDGFADLAVGAPFEDVGSIPEAGAVTVLYGTASGTTSTGSQLFTQVAGAIEAGDLFGSALAAGDFNHDGYADLAASASGEDIGSTQDAGAVSVLYGSAAGLTTAGGRLFTQVGGAIEREDRFGTALASGDFNHDGFADLAAGAPGEAVGSTRGAGAVSVLYGSAGGLTATGRLFTQVGGAIEAGDEFGFPLAAGDFNHDGFADLAAGAPFETVGSLYGAGALSILYGSASGLTAAGGRLFTQVGGAVEAEDLFGYALAAGDFDQDGVADLAAGAPQEAVGTRYGAGAVSVLYGSAAGLTAAGGRLFTQVGGVVEQSDFFGSALASGDFNHDGVADLAAGATGEGVLGLTEAGAVSILYGSSGGLTATGGRLFIQVTPEVQAGALFGFALATGDVNGDGAADLAVGAVGHNEFAGAVSILYGATGGLTTTDAQLFTQDSPGVPGASEPYDYFGAGLAAGSLGATPAAASPTGASSTARPAQPSR
jgi:FG-GAP repeat